jgi:demethylmenaquinone methyltransferase / 2-methoxy-6-polyprenyl-1,4-benzoquinol methylase
MLQHGESSIDARDPSAETSMGCDAPLAPHPVLKSFYTLPEQRQGVVNSMFDDAARHYDRITSLMSLGTGAAYRRHALKRMGMRPGQRVLDVACGTGQLSAAAQQLVGSTGEVVGVDPSDGMRRVAEVRRNIRTMRGTAERLPVESQTFDIVVMGYALRHVSDLVVAFREMKRVLRPGGRIGILEIAAPEGVVSRSLLKLYLKRIVPPVSLLATANRRASELMSYYWESIEQCVRPAAIMDAMQQAGFARPTRHQTLGVFTEYVAESPATGPAEADRRCPEIESTLRETSRGRA